MEIRKVENVPTSTARISKRNKEILEATQTMNEGETIEIDLQEEGATPENYTQSIRNALKKTGEKHKVQIREGKIYITKTGGKENDRQ